MTRTTLIATLTATTMLASPALAQDGSLYPDPSAPDASFLRVILPEGGPASVGGTELEPVEGGLTAYAEVSPGEVTIETDSGSETVEVGANTHYTWTAAAEEPELITDAMKDSPAQADLLLYNLSGAETVDLYAVEAETEALSDVAKGDHAGVGLKAPLTLTFEVRDDGDSLAALDPVDLRRGTATTVVVTGSADAPDVIATESVYQ